MLCTVSSCSTNGCGSTTLAEEILIQVHHSSPLFWGGRDNQRWVYDAARSAGLEVAVITDGVPHWLNELVPPARTEVCRLQCDTEMRDAAARLAEGNHLRGVVTYSEEFVVATARLADEFGVPSISLRGALSSSADKLRMKRCLHEASVPSPAFGWARSTAELRQTAQRLGCPVVVKPRKGGGSVAVRKMDDPSDSERIFRAVSCQARADVDPIFRGFDGTFIVEQYVPGRLVSVDGLVTSGRATVLGMTDTLMSCEPMFYQRGCWTIDIDEQCRRVAHAAVSALGFRDGVFHCEVRLNNGSPSVIEVAARLPGELIVPMYKEARGIDLLDLHLKTMTGSSAALPSRSKFAISGAYAAFPEQPGQLLEVQGVDAVRDHPCIERVYVSDRFGTCVDMFNPYAVAQITTATDREFRLVFAFVQKNLRIHTSGGARK